MYDVRWLCDMFYMYGHTWMSHRRLMWISCLTIFYVQVAKEPKTARIPAPLKPAKEVKTPKAPRTPKDPNAAKAPRKPRKPKEPAANSTLLNVDFSFFISSVIRIFIGAACNFDARNGLRWQFYLVLWLEDGQLWGAGGIERWILSYSLPAFLYVCIVSFQASLHSSTIRLC